MSATLTTNFPNQTADYQTNGGFEIYYPESDGKPMAESDVHRDLIAELIQSLEAFFADREDAYVTGNIMFYYIEGNPQEFVSPDVMVVFGVPKGQRSSFKLWEENTPAVIIEIASRSTWKIDRIDKAMLYSTFGVKEYFVFNPQFPKRLPALLPFRLAENGVSYEPLPVNEGRVFSQELGLELVDAGNTLRLFNPQTGIYLPTRKELTEQAAKTAVLEARVRELEELLKNQK